MKIANSTALVTGANRGIGKAYVLSLLQQGAKKVYACTRDVQSFKNSFAESMERYEGVLELILLDITKQDQIDAAVAKADDVDLLINNAGIANYTGFISEKNIASARQEMEVNYFGTLSVIRAFTPVLKENGGGAIVILNSVASFANFPALGTYSASKAALFSLTQGVRAELAAQGTQVVGVYPGPVDTDMVKGFEGDKSAPEETAEGTLKAVEAGEEDIFIDPFAKQFKTDYDTNPLALAKQFAEMLPQPVT